MRKIRVRSKHLAGCYLFIKDQNPLLADPDGSPERRGKLDSNRVGGCCQENIGKYLKYFLNNSPFLLQKYYNTKIIFFQANKSHMDLIIFSDFIPKKTDY